MIHRQQDVTKLNCVRRTMESSIRQFDLTLSTLALCQPCRGVCFASLKMGQGYYIANLDEKVRIAGGKLGETVWYLGDHIVDVLRPWHNPFPDFAMVLKSIQDSRASNEAVAGADPEYSSFMQLPRELLHEILTHIDQYQDFLNIAATCMPLLQILAPITNEVRRNVQSAMGPEYYPNRCWNGKRIVIMGEYTSPGDDWLHFKDHVRKSAHESALRRGTDLEEDIVKSMSTLSQIGCPNEPDYYSDEEDEVDERGHHLHDSEGQADSSTQHEVLTSEAHLYQRCDIKKVQRTSEFYDLIEETRFDIGKRMLVQSPIRVEYRSLADKIQRRVPKDTCDIPVDAGWAKEYNRRKEEDKKLERLRSEMFEAERVPMEDWSRWVRSARNDDHWIRSGTAKWPYRIINLDTLEHLDSSVIIRHERAVNDREIQLSTPFVLACNVAYSADWSCNLGYKGAELTEGRWAGHRLFYETIGSSSSGLSTKTKDVSLEMLALAEAVVIGDGFELGDLVVKPSSDSDEEDNEA
jgi:hypothetical protein